MEKKTSKTPAKRRETLAQWERSAADKKADKKAVEKINKQRGFKR